MLDEAGSTEGDLSLPRSVTLWTGLVLESGLVQKAPPVFHPLPRRHPEVGEGGVPFAAGPFGSRVVLGYFDGQLSRVSLVSVESGEEEVVLQTAARLGGGALDERTNDLFVSGIDSVTNRFVLWQVRGTDRQQVALTELARPFDASESTYSRMWISPARRYVAVAVCDADRCAISVYDRQANALAAQVGVRLADGIGLIEGAGITDEALVYGDPSRCEDARCPLYALDLASGKEQELAGTQGPGLVIESAGGPALVYVTEDDRRGDRYALSSRLTIGATDGEVYRGGGTLLLVSRSDTNGYRLPAGWFAIGRSGAWPIFNAGSHEGPAFLLSITGGARIALVDE